MKTKTYFSTLIAFSVFLFNTTDVKAQWTVQSSGTTNALRCVKFVDFNTGWAVGNKGTIIKTINGGNSWTAQTSNTTTDLYSLSFPTSTTGYVGGDLFRLLKTTNGGSTWNGYGYNWTYKLKSVSFGDVNTGVGVGENIIFKTTDGLSNILGWGSFGIQNCLFYVSNTGFTVGDGGSIIKLTGVISDFTTQTSGTTQNLNGVYFVNASIGYVVGNNGTILKTVNGGTLWSIQNSNVVVNLNSVWFTDANTGYAVGDNETILKTTDGGTTWSVQLTSGSNKLLSIYFKDANNGWIVGENGEILHTTNGGTAIVGIASTPIGSTSRCVGSNVYTTNAVNALSYIWTISPTNSGTIVSSGNSATITWNSNYSGNTTITSQGVNGSNQGAVSNSLVIYGVPSAFSLSAPANGMWNSSTPLFQWATSIGASTYNLYIDGVLKKANITATNYQILPNEAITSGMHTWYIEANNGCTTQSNETWSFRVDAIQPISFDLVTPADNSWTSDLQPNFSWSASSDVNSGLAKYQLWIDGVLNRDNISASTTSISSSSLSNGYHTWEILAVDNVGNTRKSSQSFVIKIDNRPPGITDNCLFHDGSDNYLVTAKQVNLENVITLETWIKHYTSSTTRCIMQVSNDYLGVGSDSKVYCKFFAYSNWSNAISCKTALNNNTWYHIAFTHNTTTGKINIYINGVLDLSYTVNVVTLGNSLLYVGKSFYGDIDEMRIWNCERTPTEIYNSMNKIIEPTCSDELLGYWRFNDDIGAKTFKDETNNSNTLSLTEGGYSIKSDKLNDILGGLCELKSPNCSQFVCSNTPVFSWSPTQDLGVGFQKFQLLIDDNLNTDNLTDSSYTIISPLEYGRHTWFVKGFDFLGNNQSSYRRTFYVDNAKPDTFSLLSPVDRQIVNLPTPNFSWKATNDSADGSGIRKYQLWINGVVNRDSIPISQTTVAPKSTLAQGAYTWFIKAYDNVGNVRQSTQTNTFYVDWEVPTSFNLISPSDNSTLTIARPEFKWNSSTDIGSGISKYELCITGQIPITILPTDTTVLITFDLPNGNYTWFVKAYDVAGGFTSSNTQTFTINVVQSGMEQQKLNNSIQIFPNPFAESFYINGIEGIATLTLLDVSGRIMITKQVVDNASISLNNFLKGIYIVKIITTDGIIERKLIKK